MIAKPLLLITLALSAPPGTADTPRGAAVDFDTEVLPILTKAGCNAAACHGAADGRGGFRLSLFGGDPAADLRAIAHELEGRRVHVARPEDSLLIAKPSGFVEHGGGVRLEPSGPEVATLARWIGQGARRLQLRQLTRLHVRGVPLLAERLPASTQLHVVAEFDDGQRRDVTGQTVIAPTDPGAVEVGPGGKLTLKRAGEHLVLLRYLSEVRPVSLTAPLGRRDVEFEPAAARHPIDVFIHARLQRLRLTPSPPADPATLLRRVTLDLTGRLPTWEEVQRFGGEFSEDRYRRAVDRLLGSPQFTEYWTFRLCRQLRVHSQPGDVRGAAAFEHWLRQQVKDGRSWRETVAELLRAEGDSHENGPANFYRMAAGPREQAEYVSETLLGIRIRCANCHDHPLDRWTQDDYHGLAAVFAGVEQGRVVRASGRGEVIHPRTGEAARPRIPGERFLEAQQDGRRQFSAWLTEPDNPLLARALVNRLWRALMGRGLVEPVDDLRDTNPPSHPALLEWLARDFADHDFDIRHTLRQIVLSAAYRRDSVPPLGNPSDDRYYSHFLARPLAAEVLVDAVADVTGVAQRYEGQAAGTRAIELYDLRSPAPVLDLLGRCELGESCETGRVAAGLTTQLHLLNGPLLNEKIASPRGRLAESIRRGDSDRQIVRQFYQRALGRPPSGAESEYWLEELGGAIGGADRRARLEDFVWSLLSCREFTRNH